MPCLLQIWDRPRLRICSGVAGFFPFLWSSGQSCKFSYIYAISLFIFMPQFNYRLINLTVGRDDFILSISYIICWRLALSLFNLGLLKLISTCFVGILVTRTQIKLKFVWRFWNRLVLVLYQDLVCLCSIGVVSGKAIFGPPLDEYWKKKQQEEAAAASKENDSTST